MPRVTVVNGNNVTKKLQKGDVIEFRVGSPYIEVYVTRRKQALHFVRKVDDEKHCSVCYTFQFDHPKEILEFMSRLISLTTNRGVEVSATDGVMRDGAYKVKLK